MAIKILSAESYVTLNEQIESVQKKLGAKVFPHSLCVTCCPKTEPTYGKQVIHVIYSIVIETQND